MYYYEEDKKNQGFQNNFAKFNSSSDTTVDTSNLNADIPKVDTSILTKKEGMTTLLEDNADSSNDPVESNASNAITVLNQSKQIIIKFVLFLLSLFLVGGTILYVCLLVDSSILPTNCNALQSNEYSMNEILKQPFIYKFNQFTIVNPSTKLNEYFYTKIEMDPLLILKNFFNSENTTISLYRYLMLVLNTSVCFFFLMWEKIISPLNMNTALIFVMLCMLSNALLVFVSFLIIVLIICVTAISIIVSARALFRTNPPDWCQSIINNNYPGINKGDDLLQFCKNAVIYWCIFVFIIILLCCSFFFNAVIIIYLLSFLMTKTGTIKSKISPESDKSLSWYNSLFMIAQGYFSANKKVFLITILCVLGFISLSVNRSVGVSVIIAILIFLYIKRSALQPMTYDEANAIFFNSTTDTLKDGVITDQQRKSELLNLNIINNCNN